MPKTNATTKGGTAAPGGGYVTVQEEGVDLTQRTKINFTGAGVTASDDGAVTVVDIPGGGVGSVSLTEVEIDFGTIGSPNTSWTITDAAVNATKKILVFLSPNTATGRLGNDWELDSAIFTALAGTGDFLLSVIPIGRIIGARKIYYQIV